MGRCSRLGPLVTAQVVVVPATGRRASVRRRGYDHAVLLAATDATRHDHTEVWGPPPPEIRLMQRVKDAMDPSGAFAPGRFVGGL